MPRRKPLRRMQKKRAQPANARLRGDTRHGEKLDRPTADEANLVNVDTAADDGRVTQVYRQTTEKTAESLEAMLLSFPDLGQRAQRMQQAWLRVLDRSLTLAVRGPAGLLNFMSMAELIQAQQSLYVEAFNNAVECGTRLLRLAEPVAQKSRDANVWLPDDRRRADTFPH